MFILIKNNLKKSFTTWIDLLKIMIPIIIILKILEYFNIIPIIGKILKPIMNLLGLPGSMGIVWATAMINNIYSGIIVLTSLPESQNLTIAQMTVLATIILIAHSLPIELKIVQKSGPKMLFQFFCRFFSALIIGFFLNYIYRNFNLLQDKANIILSISHNDDLFIWSINQIKNLFYIFFIIFFLILIIDFIERTKLLNIFNKLLKPILNLLDIKDKGLILTIVGLTMGLSYGGVILIEESKSGTIPKEEIFTSLTLMGLSHSIIEDTILMLFIGAHLSGILFIRVIMSILIVSIIVRIMKILPLNLKEKILYA